MSKKPSTGATLGSFRLEFEKATLPELLSRGFVGTIQHTGDASESTYWLCYTLKGKVPARLWIEAHGEMGGPERAVTGIAVVALDSVQTVAACPDLPAKFKPVSLSERIWIGTTEDELRKTLGAPSHRSGDWVSYDFEAKIPGNCPGGLDVSNSLAVRLLGGTVQAIHAGQITSC